MHDPSPQKACVAVLFYLIRENPSRFQTFRYIWVRYAKDNIPTARVMSKLRHYRYPSKRR